MGKRKNQRKDADEKIFVERRSIARGLVCLGAVLISCGLGGIAYYSYCGSNESCAPKETSRRIRFEEAAADEKLRQIYLDSIVNEEARNINEWTGFGKVIYDPLLKQFSKDSGKKVDIIDASGRNHYTGRFEGGVSKLLCETHTDTIGKKANCYVSMLCFMPDLIASEDEIKSTLDQEAKHAFDLFRDATELSTELTEEEMNKIVKEAGFDIKRLAAEAFAYDFQNKEVITGRRKVRKEFIDDYMLQFSLIFKEVLKISRQDNYDGKYAKMVINSLETKPNE